MRQLLASIAWVLILVAPWPQSVLPASPPFLVLFHFGSSDPYGAVSGNFDGDGNADLAVVLRGSDELTILISDGDGLFATGSTVPVGDGPEWIVMGDLNGDARTDLVVVNNGSRIGAACWATRRARVAAIGPHSFW